MPERPARLKIVVVGGGIAGLVAARACVAARRDPTRPAAEVTVLEAASAVGGSVAAREVAGLAVDVGAESFAVRGGSVAALVDELGLSDRVVAPNSAGAWLRLPPATASAPPMTVPLPRGGILGIPPDLTAADVIAAIGRDAATRAAARDVAAVQPTAETGTVDTGTVSLAALVEQRMGPDVARLLVSPITGGVYGTSADRLAADEMVPGLAMAVAETGSLQAAVAELVRRRFAHSSHAPHAPRASSRLGAPGAADAASERQKKAGSAVQGLAGGMTVLVRRLEAAARRAGVRIRTGTRVVRVRPGRGIRPTDGGAGDDGCQSTDPRLASHVHRGAYRDTGTGRPAHVGWCIECDGGETLHADVVIVALPGQAARRVLADASPALHAACAATDWPADTSVRLATLVLDAPELDGAPRGTGLLVAEAAGTGVRAKALTHSTAKWSWLAEQAGPHRHVLRLSYGRAGDGRSSPDATPNIAGLSESALAESPLAESAPADSPPADSALADSVLADLSLRDASNLLGVRLEPRQLLGFDATSWQTPPPAAVIGQRARVAAVTAAASDIPGLAVTGAWVAGTGLASVIPHATQAAQAILGAFSNP